VILITFCNFYCRVQEHQYITKMADEERKKRPDYRPIIEHDGVLWHRGDNQVGSVRFLIVRLFYFLLDFVFISLML
jgi:hypothetical protein